MLTIFPKKTFRLSKKLRKSSQRISTVSPFLFKRRETFFTRFESWQQLVLLFQRKFLNVQLYFSLMSAVGLAAGQLGTYLRMLPGIGFVTRGDHEDDIQG